VGLIRDSRRFSVRFFSRSVGRIFFPLGFLAHGVRMSTCPHGVRMSTCPHDVCILCPHVRIFCPHDVRIPRKFVRNYPKKFLNADTFFSVFPEIFCFNCGQRADKFSCESACLQPVCNLSATCLQPVCNLSAKNLAVNGTVRSLVRVRTRADSRGQSAAAADTFRADTCGHADFWACPADSPHVRRTCGLSAFAG